MTDKPPPPPPHKEAEGRPRYYDEPGLEQRLLAGVIRNARLGRRDYDYHPGFELGIALSGTRQRLLPGLEQFVGPGDVWMVCAWELHGYRVLTEETVSVVILFEGDVLGEERLGGIPWVSLFAAPPSLRPQVRSEALRVQVLGLADDMQEEISAKQPGWQEAVRLHLLRLLLALRREWEPPDLDVPQGLTPASDLRRIMPALEMLQKEPQVRLHLEEAAARCGLSASRFSVLFRRAMGSSFGRYAQHTRLSQAAQRLLATDLPVEAIAAELGFTDGSHLHHLFVKQYQQTPTNYRRQGQ